MAGLAGLVNRELVWVQLLVCPPVSDLPFWSWLGCLTELCVLAGSHRGTPEEMGQLLQTPNTQTQRLFLFFYFFVCGKSRYFLEQHRPYVRIVDSSAWRLFKLKALSLFKNVIFYTFNQLISQLIYEKKKCCICIDLGLWLGLGTMLNLICMLPDCGPVYKMCKCCASLIHCFIHCVTFTNIWLLNFNFIPK